MLVWVKNGELLRRRVNEAVGRKVVVENSYTLLKREDIDVSKVLDSICLPEVSETIQSALQATASGKPVRARRLSWGRL